MTQSDVRVVLDTNIWISALITPSGLPARLVSLARSGRLTLILSDYLLEEIRDVVRRPRIRRRLQFDVHEIDIILAALLPDAVYVSTGGAPQRCRDPDDDAILETAVQGRAQYLVSRDDDIKRDPDLIEQLAAYAVEVISVARLLERLDQQATDLH